MASTSNSLILGDDKVSIHDPCADIKDDYGSFKKAHVDNKDSPKSFYVIYSAKHYGYGEVKNVPADPLSGSSETVSLESGGAIESAQGYDLHDPAIALFRQAGLIGNSQQYRSTEDDLTQAFPSGVQAAVVTGGVWNLYGAKNCKGPVLKTLEKGMYLEGIDMEGQIKSVERVML